MICTIRHVTAAPPLDAADWPDAESIDLAAFHPDSSDHRPRTRARVLHDGSAVYVRFDVEDRYVRAVAQRDQDPVCRDSCVEMFLEPRPGGGYFNFEFNCGGTMLAYYITGSVHRGEGVTPLDAHWLGRVERCASLPRIVDPPITEPVTWRLAARIPFALFEHYLGRPVANTWRGNFYKCGDHTPRPHWASWQPIGDRLDFHQPERFAPLRLEGI